MIGLRRWEKDNFAGCGGGLRFYQFFGMVEFADEQNFQWRRFSLNGINKGLWLSTLIPWPFSLREKGS